MSGPVLLTGVSRDVVARCARALSATRDVVGMDVSAPRHDLGRGTFVRADLRSPAVVETVRRFNPAVVVHYAPAPSALSARRPAEAKELAVMGTLNLLSAVQQTDCRQLVLLSSVDVYPASPTLKTLLNEDTPLESKPTRGARRDLLEVETEVSRLARRRPDLTVTILRLAPLMGAGIDTPWTRYLGRPVVVSVAGYDARIQFLHPADAVTAVEAAVATTPDGAFNVAAGDVLTLAQIRRLVARPGIPVPRKLVAAAARSLHQPLPGAEVDQLAFGRVVDPARFALAAQWRARTSSRRAVEEFAAFARPGVWSADRLDGVWAGLSRFSGRDHGAGH